MKPKENFVVLLSQRCFKGLVAWKIFDALSSLYHPLRYRHSFNLTSNSSIFPVGFSGFPQSYVLAIRIGLEKVPAILLLIALTRILIEATRKMLVFVLGQIRFEIRMKMMVVVEMRNLRKD